MLILTDVLLLQVCVCKCQKIKHRKKLFCKTFAVSFHSSSLENVPGKKKKAIPKICFTNDKNDIEKKICVIQILFKTTLLYFKNPNLLGTEAIGCVWEVCMPSEWKKCIF